LTAAQTLNSISSDTLVATSRAEEAMEAILALPFEEMSYQDGAGFSIEDMDFEDPEVGSFAITPVPGTNNQLYTVRASIVAPSQGGRPAINVELVSMRSSQ
jgi:hypothetical protein